MNRQQSVSDVPQERRVGNPALPPLPKHYVVMGKPGVVPTPQKPLVPAAQHESLVLCGPAPQANWFNPIKWANGTNWRERWAWFYELRMYLITRATPWLTPMAYTTPVFSGVQATMPPELINKKGQFTLTGPVLWLFSHQAMIDFNALALVYALSPVEARSRGKLVFNGMKREAATLPEHILHFFIRDLAVLVTPDGSADPSETEQQRQARRERNKAQAQAKFTRFLQSSESLLLAPAGTVTGIGVKRILKSNGVRFASYAIDKNDDAVRLTQIIFLTLSYDYLYPTGPKIFVQLSMPMLHDERDQILAERKREQERGPATQMSADEAAARDREWHARDMASRQAIQREQCRLDTMTNSSIIGAYLITRKLRDPHDNVVLDDVLFEKVIVSMVFLSRAVEGAVVDQAMLEDGETRMHVLREQYKHLRDSGYLRDDHTLQAQRFLEGTETMLAAMQALRTVSEEDIEQPAVKGVRPPPWKRAKKADGTFVTTSYFPGNIVIHEHQRSRDVPAAGAAQSAKHHAAAWVTLAKVKVINLLTNIPALESLTDVTADAGAGYTFVEDNWLECSGLGLLQHMAYRPELRRVFDLVVSDLDGAYAQALSLRMAHDLGTGAPTHQARHDCSIM